MNLKQIGMLFFLLGVLFWVTSYCVSLSVSAAMTSTPFSPDKTKEVVKSSYYLSITAVVFMWLGAAASLFGQAGGTLKTGFM